MNNYRRAFYNDVSQTVDHDLAFSIAFSVEENIEKYNQLKTAAIEFAEKKKFDKHDDVDVVEEIGYMKGTNGRFILLLSVRWREGQWKQYFFYDNYDYNKKIQSSNSQKDTPMGNMRHFKNEHTTKEILDKLDLFLSLCDMIRYRNEEKQLQEENQQLKAQILELKQKLSKCI